MAMRIRVISSPRRQAQQVAAYRKAKARVPTPKKEFAVAARKLLMAGAQGAAKARAK